jgi:ribosomal protein S18 acetylase RimI-like enzyme
MTPATALRPMTPNEFVGFRARFIQNWAADLATVETLTLADATSQAIARTDADLPRGPATPGHYLFTIVSGARSLGSLWLSLGARGRAFLEEIVIEASERGRGHGRRAIALAEREARARGATHMALNAYKHNPRAIALYESLGYHEIKVTMDKAL